MAISGFSAGPGYDQVTHFGSVDAFYLISNWNTSAGTDGWPPPRRERHRANSQNSNL